jgi:diadenosine tetraphosphate (Ap4A) HIT family hydrolase
MLRIFFDGLSPDGNSSDCVGGGAAKPRLGRSAVSLARVEGCLACDLAEGRLPLPGGVIHETSGWFVEHTVGPLNVGTLIVKPKRHVTRLAELTDEEASELGTLLRRAAAVVDELVAPEEVYACLWSHAGGTPVHIHYVVQPVTRELMDRYSDYGPHLQAAMFDSGCRSRRE